MIKVFKFSIFVVILYAFCFQPILNKYIYVGIEFGAIILYSLNKGFRYFWKVFRKEFILLCLIILYSFFLDMFSGEVVYVDRFAVCLLQGFFFAFVLSSFIQSRKYFKENFENALIVMAFVASLITAFAIVNPSFDSIIKSLTPEYDVAYERYESTFRHRLFGLSENLAFTYPYVLSIIGFYSIVERKNFISIILLILVVISVMFNARIAFVPILLIVPYILLSRNGSIKDFFKFIVIIVCFVLLFNRLITKYSVFDNSWGFSFFEELFDLITTGHSETTNELTGRMFFLPDDSIISFLFGTGESVFLSTTHNSDVGYVIQMYYGGLFFMILILALMTYMAFRVFIVLGKKNWFAFIFGISIFVLNFKGFYFASTPGFRFISFLYVYYILKQSSVPIASIVR